MVPSSHVTSFPYEDNVISLFPERARAAVCASRYSSEADDPFAIHATTPASEWWYEDELASTIAQ